MKILHTSDWHLGKRLDDFSRLEEQQAVMEEICEIAEREETDVVLVSGDLFDTFNPPTEAVELTIQNPEKAHGKRTPSGDRYRRQSRLARPY